MERSHLHVAEDAARQRCRVLKAPLQPAGHAHLSRTERASLACERIMLRLQQIPRGFGMKPQRRPTCDIDDDDILSGKGSFGLDGRVTGAALRRHNHGVFQMLRCGRGWSASAAGRSVRADAGHHECDWFGQCDAPAMAGPPCKNQARAEQATAAGQVATELWYLRAMKTRYSL